jgi:3-oxoadipate enol-lactonase/4-carboxymuconolactone decarboxylase
VTGTSVSVHHYIEGPAAAPALLLIHSLGSDHTLWDPIVPELTRHFRVLRYDQRGAGASPVPDGPYEVADLAADALALLDRLGVARAHVCGTSLGGAVGLWLARHAPARVERLAVLCSSARFGPAQAWQERAALVRSSQDGTAAVAQAVVGRWFTPGFAAQHPKLIARCMSVVLATPREGYAACCDALARWDFVSELPHITVPTWLLAAEGDPATPPSHAYLMAGLIPNARVDVIGAAAHAAFIERPALVTRLLIDHLHGHPDTSPLPDPERARRGELVRRGVLGDAHVDRARANTSPLTAPFQDLITRYAWGEIWSRPGLSRAERSLVTLSVLAALHHDDELAMHVRAALRNGLTPEQIQEVLLQVGIYAGVPAANRAFAIAQRVLSELAAEEG